MVHRKSLINVHCSVVTAFRRTKASLVTQTVKRLPTMRETQVRSLGHEDPLEKGMAKQPSILA